MSETHLEPDRNSGIRMLALVPAEMQARILRAAGTTWHEDRLHIHGGRSVSPGSKSDAVSGCPATRGPLRPRMVVALGRNRSAASAAGDSCLRPERELRALVRRIGGRRPRRDCRAVQRRRTTARSEPRRQQLRRAMFPRNKGMNKHRRQPCFAELLPRITNLPSPSGR